MSKSVLLATRPLVPPWDEASKNFAYFLGREIKNHKLTLLTTNVILTDLPKNTIQKKIFSNGRFNLKTKIELVAHLIKTRDQFDLTHYLFTPTKFNTNIIKALAKPKYGKTIQTIATLREDLYSPEELKKLFFADKIIVYTDLSKQKLEKLNFKNVTRIYPGIDLNLYSPQPKNNEILKKLGLKKEQFIIIYPGEYSRLGATDMLAQTFIKFFQENPATDMRFVFACRVKNEVDNQKKKEIQKLVLLANVSKYIIFLDTIFDMPRLYNTADVIIFPVENLKGKFDVPLVIIEAYACGKPVILSDLPQFKEFSSPEICVTIPKNSGEKLLSAIIHLKKNIQLSEIIGKNARHFVEKNFDLKDTAKQYENIYSTI